MKNLIIRCLIFTFSTLTYGQELLLKTTLDDSIQETSGLIKLDERLITHNDSGSEPELYEIDSNTGDVIRTVTVKNATNIDWEDICYDNTYIYIGDFGNNYGSRTDLKVYRILIKDYLTTTNNTVMAERINFSYLQQSDFTPSAFSTNFDAESLISYNGKLYIFTKNWINKQTDIYALPKVPGTYQVEKIGSIDAQGLVTGADYNPVSKTIILTGYLYASNFIIEINDFNFINFSSGTINRYIIKPPKNTSTQIESIAFISENKYYLTSEKYKGNPPALIELNTRSLSINKIIKEKDVLIYPNPSSNNIQVEYDNFSVVKIYDLKGVLHKESTNRKVYIGDLDNGTYILSVKNINNSLTSKKMIKE